MHAVSSLANRVHRFDVFDFDPKSGALENMFFLADPEVNDQGFRATAIDDVSWIDAREVRDLLSRFGPGPGVVKSVNPLVELEGFGDVFGWQDRDDSFHSAKSIIHKSDLVNFGSKSIRATQTCIGSSNPKSSCLRNRFTDANR